MDTAGKIAEIFSNIFTGIGIIVGGIWTYLTFVKNRLSYPKVEVKHQVIQKHLGDGKILLHVNVVVDNLGDVLVNFESGETRLLQILPLVGEAGEAIQKGEDPVNPGRYDIDWPKITGRVLIAKDNPCEIEPKEKETFPCDFVIKNDVQIVEIYSYFENITKKGKELGWPCTTVYEIEKD